MNDDEKMRELEVQIGSEMVEGLRTEVDDDLLYVTATARILAAFAISADMPPESFRVLLEGLANSYASEYPRLARARGKWIAKHGDVPEWEL